MADKKTQYGYTERDFFEFVYGLVGSERDHDHEIT